MNTIYNIDNSCNTLEQYIQFTDKFGVAQSGITTLITIPNGAYNINNLMNMINQKFYETYMQDIPNFANLTFTGSKNLNVYDPQPPAVAHPVRGFGYFFHSLGNVTPYSGLKNPFVAACGLDSQIYNSMTSNSVFRSPSTNPGPQFKVRFWAPCFEKLARVSEVNDSNGNSVNPTNVISSISLIHNNYSGLLEKLGFPLTLAQNLSLPNYTGALQPKGYTIGFDTSTFGSNTNVITANPKYVLYKLNPNASSPTAAVDYIQHPAIYNQPYYDSSSPRSGREAAALIAPTFPALDYPRNIYVSIDSISTRNRCACRKLPYGSVFAKIPNLSTPVGNMGTTFGSYLYYAPTIPQEIYVPGLSLDSMTIRLYDDNGETIQWNGGRWTITLSVKYAVDVGSAGMEDVTLGRTYRPYLKQTPHDPLETRNEFHRKRAR